VLRHEQRGNRFGDAWGCSEQEETPTHFRRPLGERRDQVDAGDPRGERAALAAGGPGHAPAVGEAESGVLEQAVEGRVAPRQHDEFRIHGRDQVVAPGGQQLLDPVQRAFAVEVVDAHAEHPDRAHVRADYHWPLLPNPSPRC